MKELKIKNHYTSEADAVIYHGDRMDFITGFPHENVKLIVTSPQYDMGKSYETNLDFDTYIAEQEKVKKDNLIRVLLH